MTLRHARISVVASIVIAAALVIPASDSFAKLDPMRFITANVTRPEVIIILDNSGSMRWNPGHSGTDPGTDCTVSGSTAVCGDGLCSSTETAGSCANDCGPADDTATTAGSVVKCASSATGPASRMAMSKRALAAVLPSLRTTASFSLISFTQNGYYRYYTSPSTPTTKARTIYLSEWELRATGAWTGGAGWNGGTNAPQSSFTVNGTTYTLLSGTSQTAKLDSLYRANVGTGFSYSRHDFSSYGKSYFDGSFTWNYVGSYWGFTAHDRIDNNTSPNSHVETNYLGPQYTSAGTTYVYKPFSYRNNDMDLDDSSNDSKIYVPLTDLTDQPTHDTQLAKIMTHMNFAANGGLHASASTPTETALDLALAHFQDRHNGTGPFSAADPAGTCRKRIILVLSDGAANDSPVDAAKRIYQWSCDPTDANCTSGINNKIIVRTIGLPGLPDITELNEIASAADDGDETNGSASALSSSNEVTLIQNIKTVLFDLLQGDYTTGGAGAASSSTGTVPDNVAIIPSTTYPGWDGHLRAVDLTLPSTDPGYELWDAATVLAGRATDRNLFTTLEGSFSATPIPLLCSGAPNLTGTCSGGVSVKDAWPGTVPSDALVTAAITYITDKKLRAMMRSTPATVGTPPQMPASLPGHAAFQAANGSRNELVYAVSNGTLHAFEKTNGNEVWGYVPPHAWPKILQIANNGGQSDDPTEFVYALASSPRIADMYVGATPAWQTSLILTAGPGGSRYYALDITSATAFTLTADSKFNSTAAAQIGETWSIPAVFHVNSTGQPMAAAFASGYGSNTGGYHSYYTAEGVWADANVVTDPIAADASQITDYARVANVSAALRDDQSVIASYVADPSGRIYRQPSGGGSGAALTIGSPAGVSHPLYFAPAAFNISGTDSVILAFSSGAFQETHSWMSNASFESRLFIRRETGGTVDGSNNNYTCAVSQVCTTSCTGSAPVGGCVAPSAKAVPLGSPVIVDNIESGNPEVFFLYYDPPSSSCSGKDVAVGDTYFIRVSTNGATNKVITSKQYAGVVASGFAIVGGGTDIVLINSTRGASGKAAAQVLSGTQLANPGVAPPIIEGYREVD
ncbi:MAG: hypothetical protein KC503_14580 [Myxococcales bacterium]|nr:hypothetical protein [Myxococcales bacterium]